jgi:hypothetical protein
MKKQISFFKKELDSIRSDSGEIIWNRKYKNCIGCGNSKSRVINIYYNFNYLKKRNFLSQLSSKESNLKFELSDMGFAPLNYANKKACEIIINEHSIVINSSTVDVSFFKMYKNRAQNKSFVIIDVTCLKCRKTVNRNFIYKKSFIEAFLRKI